MKHNLYRFYATDHETEERIRAELEKNPKFPHMSSAFVQQSPQGGQSIPVPLNLQPFRGRHLCNEGWDDKKGEFIYKEHSVIFVPEPTITRDGDKTDVSIRYRCSRCGYR